MPVPTVCTVQKITVYVYLVDASVARVRLASASVFAVILSTLATSTYKHTVISRKEDHILSHS